MARTQSADYETRREAIVEKAANLFAAHGFPGTSIAQIAKGCDISKSLLYYYYPSKDEVLHAVMMSHLDTLLEDVATVEACVGSRARDRLGQLLRLFMAHYVGAAARQKVLLSELDCLPRSRREGIVAKQRLIVDYVQTLLIEITPALAATQGLARVKAMLVFGMINWTVNWYKADGAVSPERIAELALQMATGCG